MMGDITQNFSYSEFACRGSNCCGHSAPMDRSFVEKLQDLRDDMQAQTGTEYRMNITSGFRCNRHNSRTKNASPGSKHCFGIAADIRCPDGMHLYSFALFAESAFASGGIGIYVFPDGSGTNRLHLDDRTSGASRWGYIGSRSVDYETALRAAQQLMERTT